MIDPVTLAVISGRLEQIADEMDATLFRSAFNPIIAEAHDASHGLYDAETGATLIQGKSGLPVFVGAMSFALGGRCAGRVQGAGVCRRDREPDLPASVPLTVRAFLLGDLRAASR